MSVAAVMSMIPSNTTDALFRIWGAAISVKLAAAGWVQTSDTGQINWATVLAPTVVSTSQGYEIWRMNDALQSTAPIFLKIEYGSFTSVAGNIAIWYQFGTGSNGSGTLTGMVTTRRTVGCALTATVCNWYFSGDTNRFGFAMVGSTTSNSLLWSVERTVDVAGAVSAEGVLIIDRSGGSWGQIAWNRITGPYTAIETSLGALPPTQAPFGVFGTEVAMYPIYHNKGVFLPHGLNMFSYWDGTLTPGSTVSFSVYGASHAYMPLSTTQFGLAFRLNVGTSSVMMRYE